MVGVHRARSSSSLARPLGLLAVLCLLGLLLVAHLRPVVEAQDKDGPPTPEQVADEEEEDDEECEECPKEANVDDAEVRKAAEFAVKHIADNAELPPSKVRLIRVVDAKEQEASGTNYIMELEVAIKDEKGFFSVLVFKDLSGEMSLVFQEAESEEEEEKDREAEAEAQGGDNEEDDDEEDEESKDGDKKEEKADQGSNSEAEKSDGKEAEWAVLQENEADDIGEYS